MRLLSILVLTLGMTMSANAHDYDRPELAPWFQGLANRAQVRCCDGSEAVYVSDPDWRSMDGHYQVRINGQWLNVPDSAVVNAPNLYGPTLVWMYPLKVIRCFLPGSGT